MTEEHDYNQEILDSGFVELETLPIHDTKEWNERDPSNLLGMVLHQSLEERGKASGNAKYHSGPNHISEDGLPGLSYTVFIEPSGKIILANSVEKKTYSQGYKDPEGVDENALYIGVCVGGNFSGPGYEGTQGPTLGQIEAVKKLWALLSGIWGWDSDALLGHYHFGKPACPGFDLMAVIDNIRPPSFTTTVERQKALLKLGFYKGCVDGVWGFGSKAALIEFQRKAGLDPDGVWGVVTTRAVKDAMGM